jgi:hypothetical protein
MGNLEAGGPRESLEMGVYLVIRAKGATGLSEGGAGGEKGGRGFLSLEPAGLLTVDRGVGLGWFFQSASEGQGGRHGSRRNGRKGLRGHGGRRCRGAIGPCGGLGKIWVVMGLPFRQYSLAGQVRLQALLGL